MMRELYKKTKQLFPLGDLTEQRHDLVFVSIPHPFLSSLLRHLRDKEGFSHLVLLTAVDWLERGEFQLTYLLCNRSKAWDMGVRVVLPREGATMESIHTLWPTAATYQRELKEMFGIDFPGSPGVNDDFILEGWDDIPPYRRDFDTLKFAEARFTQRPGRESLDPAQHMAKHHSDGS
ncbi:MAG: NADH-quinone oxidoreductase subunit C [Magnetococcales bacterium]|nr:NADH-quinone oxidoreductase subunit C [Magnetococcales bacterium]